MLVRRGSGEFVFGGSLECGNVGGAVFVGMVVVMAFSRRMD